MSLSFNTTFILYYLLFLHLLQFLFVLLLAFGLQSGIVFSTHLELSPLDTNLVATQIVLV